MRETLQCILQQESQFMIVLFQPQLTLLLKLIWKRKKVSKQLEELVSIAAQDKFLL